MKVACRFISILIYSEAIICYQTRHVMSCLNFKSGWLPCPEFKDVEPGSEGDYLRALQDDIERIQQRDRLRLERLLQTQLRLLSSSAPGLNATTSFSSAHARTTLLQALGKIYVAGDAATRELVQIDLHRRPITERDR